VRILALSDQVHPFIYQARFPGNMPPLDLIVMAGDLPGSYIEFVATKATVPVVYVHGNHTEEYLQDYLGNLSLPGGAINAHGRVVEVAGLCIAGWGGCPRYNERSGPGQYTEGEAKGRVLGWWPQLTWHKLRGKSVDLLLSHAPPLGPHAGSDYAHRGSDSLNLFHKLYQPKLHIHGHVHLYEAQPKREYLDGTTRVINAFEYTLIEL
jgi:uncharacterized protein